MMGRNKGVVCIAVFLSLFFGGVSEAQDFCELKQAISMYFGDAQAASGEIYRLQKELKEALRRGADDTADLLEEQLQTARLKFEANTRRLREANELQSALRKAPPWVSKEDKQRIVCESGHRPDWDLPPSSRTTRRATQDVVEQIMARHPNAPPGFNTREFLQSLKRSPNRGRACQLAQTVATGILVAWSFFNAEAGTPNVPEVSCPDSAVPEDPSAKPRGTPTVFAGTDGAEPQVCKPLVCPPQAPAASASPYPAATALGGNRSGKK